MGIIHGHWMAAGLSAAIRHRVFDELATAARTASELASTAELPVRNARLLLDALVGMGLLERDGGLYRNTPVTDRYLVRGRARYLGDLSESLTTAGGVWGIWSDFGHTVGGSDPGEAEHSRRFDPGEYRVRLVEGIAGLTRNAADLVVAELGGALESGSRLLDIGGGSGVLSEVLMGTYPQLRVTQVDGPSINRIARERMEASGLGARFTTVDGHYPDLFLPQDEFDVIVYSSVAHLKSGWENQRMLAAAADHLAEGGTLVFHDYLAGVPGEGDTALLTNLNWLLVGHGEVYEFGVVCEWLRRVGLVVERSFGTGLWSTVVTARKAEIHR